MELEDLSAVFALGERLFTADLWPNLYRTWDEYELVQTFASDSETCLVAELDDRVVGFALGTLIDKRRSAWTYGYLVWLGVDPDLARRGVGKRLVNRLTEIFIDQGARIMIVDTEADNDPAVHFFRRHGFGNETRHVYMTKNLTSHPGYLRRKSKQQAAAARRSDDARGEPVVQPPLADPTPAPFLGKDESKES
jgi:ribosomal protein S18 acetylase RimI-like enzyme